MVQQQHLQHPQQRLVEYFIWLRSSFSSEFAFCGSEFWARIKGWIHWLVTIRSRDFLLRDLIANDAFRWSFFLSQSFSVKSLKWFSIFAIFSSCNSGSSNDFCVTIWEFSSTLFFTCSIFFFVNFIFLPISAESLEVNYQWPDKNFWVRKFFLT